MQLQTTGNNLPSIIKQKTSNFTRNDILSFEAEMMKTPGIFIGDNAHCLVDHIFANGVYARVMHIPMGTLISGKIHKKDCINIVDGDITVVSEEGRKRIKGQNQSFVSPSGTKRIGYAHKDTLWINIHPNPDNERDLVKIEEKVIAKNYTEYDKYISEGNNKLLENSTEDNCGIVALKNFSQLKNISISTLVQMAKDNGIKLYPYKVSVRKLSSLAFPAILHSEDHFVYVESKEKIDKKLKYTGNVLLTKKHNYPEIKKSELDKIQGGSWAAAVAASASLTNMIIGTQITPKPTSQCEIDCVNDCKGKHGALFSGRVKCIKGCKPQCAINATGSPVSDSGINWWYVAGGAILLFAIIYAVVRLKKR